ncbi:ubiquinol-cytochrome c reductase iron-sulfur subunit [Pigmentiphaga sp. GD03639]|jgi:ubiquinol-cytochrome c reductase iron-sulfur subunit|uniref:Ubiquinol-cytochrome c reductase iron-sulfur subunit n=1 Tax=Pigmentiphaga daeguensis TaxID=414049 RepID=A0ABP3MB83_9BURK|nr:MULTISPECIES: ubiquinol-cytochrome c reductase iron-sulfur subunit [unclassified Pigmentiphaga]MDH2236442.1 ubiquinol-cytochrome c reductase iron-sulfur subunit [Pigmentiphaga sp. GD03639]OVZ63533.1 ubiquinol-cytochrome c reductase iron-sulfur subunit [Pigmentiphaga sp. NML030171]
MSQDKVVDADRRFWVGTTCAVGGVAAVGVAVPFVSTFAPSERAKAAGAPVEVEIGDMQPGEMRTVEWRGKPVWIIRRTPEQLATLKEVDAQLADPNSERNPNEITPEYARNEYRSIKPEYLVAVGICPHLGCSPTARFATGPQPNLPADWHGGFLCPCHGSTFDMAGRVYKNKPSPDNLTIPPYEFVSDTKIVVGVDKNNKA